MKRYLVILFVFFITMLLPQLEGLHRDHRAGTNDDHEYNTYFCHKCLKFLGAKKELWDEVDLYIHLIPTNIEKKCERCILLSKYFPSHVKKDGVYALYLDWHSRDYFELLKDHLFYCADNVQCQCYWPEVCKML